jgi:hypothetical protein
MLLAANAISSNTRATVSFFQTDIIIIIITTTIITLCKNEES